MYYILLSIIILIIIYNLLFKKKNKDNVIENFYTLFLPFYYPETIKKYQVYKNNFIYPQGLQKYKTTFLISNEQLKYTYLHLFLKSLIAYNYPIVKVNLLAPNNNDRDLVPVINNINDKTKNQLAIVPGPILANVYTNGTYDNLRYVTTMNEQYIFLIANIRKETDTLRDLDGKTIGVGYRGSLWDQCATDIFRNSKINYKPYYSSLRLMLQQLYNGKIDAILLTDTYPSNIMNFIFTNFYNIHLISLGNVYNLDFYYTKTTLDLNKLPSLYLPQPSYREKHVDFLRASLFSNVNRLSVKYLFYYSQFTTYKFINYLITNTSMNEELCYMITKHIFNNEKLLKKSTNAYLLLPIEFSPGAKKYYIEKGYMSNNSHRNCIYMYGKQKCTDQSLKNNLLYYDKYYNIL